MRNQRQPTGIKFEHATAVIDERGTIDGSDGDPVGGRRSPQRRRLVQSCLFLAASVLLVLPVFLWFGYSRHGVSGVFAALIAAAVCWGASTAALILTQLMQGTDNAVAGMFLAIAVRTGVPFAVGIFLAQAVGGPLAQAEVFGMILVYYLITLVVETLLVVRLKTSFQAVH